MKRPALYLRGPNRQAPTGFPASFPGSEVATESIFDTPTDTVTPVIPDAPVIDLLAISDRGGSTTDNITNDTEPQFSIDADSNVEAGDTVHVYDNAVEIGTGITLTAGQAAGTDPLFLGGSPLADGTHPITMTVENSAGESAASNEITLVVNTSLGACTVALAEGDDETTDTTPPIRVTAAGAVENDIAYVHRESDGLLLGTKTWDATDAINGYADVTPSDLSVASHDVYGYVEGTASGSGAGTFTAEDEYTFSVVVIAVEFDGANDYIDYGDVSASLTDSKLVTISMWVKLPAWPALDGRIINFDASNNTRFGLFYFAATSGRFSFQGRQPAGGASTLVVNVDDLPINSWFHFLVSIDMASGVQAYVNDAAANLTVTTRTDAVLDFTCNHTSIGRFIAAQANLFDGYISELWMDIGTALDISVQANRRKFISAAGKPVDLGADGSTPTGSQPEFFHSGAVASWHTNKGTVSGGTETGEITEAADSPN